MTDAPVPTVEQIAEITSRGVLSAVVWPTYAGAVKSNGDEPMFVLDYKRGPIIWELNGAGVIRGRAVRASPPAHRQ